MKQLKEKVLTYVRHSDRPATSVLSEKQSWESDCLLELIDRITRYLASIVLALNHRLPSTQPKGVSGVVGTRLAYLRLAF